MVLMNTPATIALVITPQMLAPIATGRIIAKGFSSIAARWASLAVVGTQDTPCLLYTSRCV